MLSRNSVQVIEHSFQFHARIIKRSLTNKHISISKNRNRKALKFTDQTQPERWYERYCL